jgi:7-cyano-7-deazaguanine synthase in queuosine biosynthesis
MHADTLLLDRGDLASLTLLAIQPEPGRVALWHPRIGEPAQQRRANAVRQHAQLYGIEQVHVEIAPERAAHNENPAARRTITLLQCAVAAAELGFGRVLAPVHVGPDHLAVADALERALGVASLAAAAGRELLVDLPLVDLTDRQLVEIADDCGAPMLACWPCEGDEPEPCGRCAACMRWTSAFHEAGVPWPWSHAPAGA